MEKLHVGTMGWSYDFWKGKSYSGYPPGDVRMLLNKVKNDSP